MKMVSSSSPLPTLSDESSTENQKIAVAKKLASNGLFLSSSAPYYFINQTPLVLLRQPPNTKFNLQSQVAEAARAVGEFHSSVASAADGCLRMLRSFAFQTPIFAQLFALPSHFHNFSQMHLRPYRNLNSLSSHNFAAVLPGDSVAGVVVANGVLNFLNIYNTILVVRLVLTWFPNSPPAIVSPLSTLCDPYLNIFRGIVPPLGGLDLSPILAFLVLNAFTSAASALPAELPQEGTSGPNISTAQQKWMQRLQGSRRKASGGGK